jgi:hypothetical protein
MLLIDLRDSVALDTRDEDDNQDPLCRSPRISTIKSPAGLYRSTGLRCKERHPTHDPSYESIWGPGGRGSDIPILVQRVVRVLMTIQYAVSANTPVTRGRLSGRRASSGEGSSRDPGERRRKELFRQEFVSWFNAT